jgi:hypothetical protein
LLHGFDEAQKSEEGSFNDEPDEGKKPIDEIVPHAECLYG